MVSSDDFGGMNEVIVVSCYVFLQQIIIELLYCYIFEFIKLL